jgi:DNA topoisomerase-3
MSTQQVSTRLGFVPAAQVSRVHLVELATKAMAALEEFMQALTPVDVKPLPPKAVENKQYEWPQGGKCRTKEEAATDPQCPECNDAMRKRTSVYGDFWGCVNYPTCQGKRNIDGSVGRRQRTKRGAMSQ